jgi:DNA processing protein
VTVLDEQAAVLALTKATTGPWHHTTRIIKAGGARRLIEGDVDGFTGPDAEDNRAHARDLLTRRKPDDLQWARELIGNRLADDVALVVVGDAAYPGNLWSRFDAQPFLWTRGRRLMQDYRSVAIAGEHDVDHAAAAARTLAQAGMTVVAGLATELDAAVHHAALDAGGRTLAVLAGGIARPAALEPYADLARQIADEGHGAVISPFWPDTIPSDHTAALAHIVLSGIADSVYIVDGASDSACRHLAHVAVGHGGYVLVPDRLHHEQPWVAHVGRGGGTGVVRDLRHLTTRALELADAVPRIGPCGVRAETTPPAVTGRRSTPSPTPRKA